MQRKIYQTRLKPERRQEYIDAHRKVSADLMRRYRDAGMRTCAVYLLGDDLVLVLEAEDLARSARILADIPRIRNGRRTSAR
jgi:L-rhamnose mutarotase